MNILMFQVPYIYENFVLTSQKINIQIIFKGFQSTQVSLNMRSKRYGLKQLVSSSTLLLRYKLSQYNEL